MTQHRKVQVIGVGQSVLFGSNTTVSFEELKTKAL